ncbi:MAG: cell division protein ZapB [Spirochaetales bacterium]|nr:cell division protein ZapB [Spirochaetales bacterium]
MISLEQIRSLEHKINLLVEELSRLRDENSMLRATVKSTQTKTADLESMVNAYKQEQEAIEKGILSVLSKLDKLEDEVSLSGSPAKKDAPRGSGKRDETVVKEKKPNEKDAVKASPAPEDRAEGTGQDGGQNELDIF